jgi:hypothetical protein
MDTGEINVIISQPSKYCYKKRFSQGGKTKLYLSSYHIFPLPPNALSMKSEQLYHSLGGKKYRQGGGILFTVLLPP